MAKAIAIAEPRKLLGAGFTWLIRITVPLAFAWAAMHVVAMSGQNLVEWDAYPSLAILCLLAFAAYGMIMG